MPSQTKKEYVADLFNQLQDNPHLVLVAFSGTTHQRLEEFRKKLRESSQDAPAFTILKNSLFKIAFEKYNAKHKVVSREDAEQLLNLVDGQLGLILMPEEWLSNLKTVKEFAKEEEGFVFKAGVVDGKVYEESGLTKLADLPGIDELVARIIGTLKAPQTRLVYALQYPNMKLVNVLKNAGESPDQSPKS